MIAVIGLMGSNVPSQAIKLFLSSNFFLFLVAILLFNVSIKQNLWISSMFYLLGSSLYIYIYIHICDFEYFCD